MMTLNRIFRRSLAVALLLAVPALFYAAVVAPLAAYRDGLNSEIAGLEDNLARYRTFAAERDRLAAELGEAEAAQPDAGLYLEAPSDALAAAGLQDLLNTIVEDNGGVLNSVRVLAGSQEGSYRRVAVEVLFESHTKSLRDILYAVETGKPFLFVQKLEVAHAMRFGAGSNADTATDLDVLLEVYAYRKGAAS